MTSNLHDIHSRSGENAQMMRVERLLKLPPPPHIAAESRADGVFGAFKRISAGRRVLTAPRIRFCNRIAKLAGRVVPNAPQATISQNTGNGGVRTRRPTSWIDENHLCPTA